MLLGLPTSDRVTKNYSHINIQIYYTVKYSDILRNPVLFTRYHYRNASVSNTIPSAI